MATLKQIQEAIKEKQKGLNADIETLLIISKENTDKERREKEEKIKIEKEYKNALNKLGVKVLK